MTLTGGTSNTGGTLSTSGTTSTGGVLATGGTSTTGGVTTTGGTVGTGGVTAAGGLGATGGTTSAATSCTIQGNDYASGTTSPDHICKTCQPSQSTTSWSDVPVSSCVQAIAGRYYHTCAVVNGGAYCWGDNSFGELGNSLSSSAVPVLVQGLGSGVTAIATGGDNTVGAFSCALNQGAAQCWGYNGYGQLGNPAVSGSNPVPVQVQGFISGVTAIATGAMHTCAALNGSAYCWGYNASGELGTTTMNSSVPGQVFGLTSGVQAISGGSSHTCALINGGVQCWGYGYDGEFGNNSTNTSPVPVSVSALTSNVQVMGAGFAHTCAVSQGLAYCWGYNNFGQLGDNSGSTRLVPIPVSGI